jgi:hypothetical protein
VTGQQVPPGKLGSPDQLTLAAERFPGFAARPNSSQVGHKFASLAEAAEDARVPPAIAVPAVEFQRALNSTMRIRIQVLLDDLRATVGAFLGESLQQIELAAAGIRIGDEARHLLTARLYSCFAAAGGMRFAVRSSGLAEDTPDSSMAGVYQSFLDVPGPGAVIAAVEDCWRSYFSAPAVAARARRADFSAAPRFAVMIQEFVLPDLSGVAFCGLDGDSDHVVVDYVTGTADALVAGEEVPYRASSTLPGQLPPGHGAVISEVIRLVRRLRLARQQDVDVEWAANRSGVSILQVRPVTVRRSEGGRGTPPFWTRRLYFESPPDGLSLGAVAAVYTSFEAKRGPLNRLALRHAIDVTHGWIIGFAEGGLDDPGIRQRFHRVLLTGTEDECLVDLGDSLRQIVMPKDEVADFTHRVAGRGSLAGQQHVLLVRDYVRGDLGLISRVDGRNLVIEYSEAGLMALNRGTAGARRIVVGKHSIASPPVGAGPVAPYLGKISTFTELAGDMYGDVAVEWVLAGGRLVFLDYSVLTSSRTVALGADLVLSAGNASGPVLSLGDDDYLRRLSIGPAVSIGRAGRLDGSHQDLAALIRRVKACSSPPIIRAPRPYAMLSVLIGAVSGFVFDEGSALCHLAILLREAGVPAVCANGVGPVPDGAHGVISLGAFSVAPHRCRY